jgi:enoyl-CoA hydratase
MAIRLDQPLAHVLQITIDRPERRNALDMYHFRDLSQAWRDLAEDDDLWLAIITGVDGSFMSGADLKDFIPQVTELSQRIQSGEVAEVDGCRVSDATDAVLRNSKLYKPVIAAVDGPCVAGGMEMLCGTDIRIATPRATFGVLEPKRGLFAGGGTTARLPRQIGYAAAMEFLLCADAVSAERALDLGLLNAVVPEDELMPTALRYAERILVNSPFSVRATKESVVRGTKGTLRDAYEVEAELSAIVFKSEDAKEGPKAFAEKRPPVWQNR